MNQRKLDLERRLKLANNDKSNLAAALDESGDKILLLEKLLNEKDAKLMELVCEVNELRDSSLWLSNELESMLSLNERLANEQTTGSAGADGIISNTITSTTAANSSDELHNVSQRKRSQLIEQLRELRLKNRSRLRAREFRLLSSASGDDATRHNHNNRKLAGDSSRRRRRRRKHFDANSSSLFDEIESSSNRWSQDDDEDDEENSDEDDEENSNKGDLLVEPQRIDEIVAEIYTLLHRFHSNLLLRKEELLLTTGSGRSSSHHHGKGATPAQQHLYSASNSPDDSGISADDGGKSTI